MPEFEGVSMRCVSTSASHTAFVTADGALYTCGLGTDGQLGLGDMTKNHGVPQRVYGIDGRVTAAACGNRHTLALTDVGAVYAFGCNKHGQLGTLSENDNTGNSGDNLIPRRVEAFDGADVRHVSAGDDFSACVDSSGSVYTWGCATLGRLGHGDDRPAPSLTAWLLGAARETESLPRLVRGVRNVSHVVCGKHHAMAVTRSGALYSWGCGRHHLLGTESEDDQYAPLLIPAQVRVSDIAAGGTHALVTDEAGNVYAYGVNERGALGLGTGGLFNNVKTPTPITIDTITENGRKGRVLDGAAGWMISAAVIGRTSDNGTGSGQVVTWGSVAAGALGVRDDVFDCWAPRKVGIEARKVVAGAGGSHMFAY